MIRTSSWPVMALPIAHNAMNNALKVALRGQDIPALTIHDLRRTASTLLHEHGWPAD
jgi:integrase